MTHGIRAGIGPKPTISFNKIESGPSPGTPGGGGPITKWKIILSTTRIRFGEGFRAMPNDAHVLGGPLAATRSMEKVFRKPIFGVETACCLQKTNVLKWWGANLPPQSMGFPEGRDPQIGF